MFFGRAASGRRCPRTCRRSRRHITDFMLWDWDGTLERIHHALYVAVRDREGREASPSAAVIRQPERQASVKKGASLDPQGFDAGKKVTGRNRHILVDTLGLLLSVIGHPADMQDRDGARELLRTARRSVLVPSRSSFADVGYQGRGSPDRCASACGASVLTNSRDRLRLGKNRAFANDLTAPINHANRRLLERDIQSNIEFHNCSPDLSLHSDRPMPVVTTVRRAARYNDQVRSNPRVTPCVKTLGGGGFRPTHGDVRVRHETHSWH